ncbi:O-antigen ligase family protein [Deinococcus wulumuqiensis]
MVNFINANQLIILILAFLFFADGLLPRIQMLMLNNNVFIGNSTLKILLIALIALSAIASKIKKSYFRSFGFVFLLYLIIRSIVGIVLNGEYDVIYIISGLFSYYSLVVFAIFFTYLKITQKKQFFRIRRSPIIIFGLLCSLIGIYQYRTTDPIFAVESSDGAFSVLSYQFGYYIRGFSIFSSPLNFAHFLVYVFTLSFLVLIKNKHKAFMLLPIAIIVYGIYSSITRAAYFELIFSIISILMLTISGYRSLKIIPVIYLIMGIFIVNYAPIISNSISSNIGSDFSVGLRLAQWSQYIDGIQRSGVINLLFGSGYFQTENINLSVYGSTIIDNTYLAILSQIGVLGGIIFLLAIGEVYLKIIIISSRYNDIFLDSALIIFSTYPFRAFLNIEFNSFFIILVLTYSYYYLRYGSKIGGSNG